MTPEQLVEITRISLPTADFWAPLLVQAMDAAEISGSLSRAAFVAESAYESAYFSRLVENMHYRDPLRIVKIFRKFDLNQNRIIEPAELEFAKGFARNPERLANFVYANRLGNGDEASGDGHRHRGRGLFQVTGRDNYKLVKQGIGRDCVGNPALLEEPELAAASAAFLWRHWNLNEPAERMDIDAVTRKIHGPGMLGKAERAMMFHRGVVILA